MTEIALKALWIILILGTALVAAIAWIFFLTAWFGDGE